MCEIENQKRLVNIKFNKNIEKRTWKNKNNNKSQHKYQKYWFEQKKLKNVLSIEITSLQTETFT